MTGIYPIIVGLFCSLLLSANAHSSSSTSNHLTNQPHHHLQHYEALATPLKSWTKSKHSRHPHLHLKFVHGVVNIIGWGILVPAGAISARYYRKLRLRCEECYSLHTVSQVSGFIVGTVGWGLGISLRNSAAKQHPMTTHGILGTILLSFSTLQVLGVWLQPHDEEENRYRKYWVIYHNVLGYALIILIIANIFQGIDNHQISHGSRWKWCYAVILGVFAFTALVLELFSCCLKF
ncbi:PREDICTED: cytochrome b561 and DOMON domain-containing protein At5g47530-like [Ipomoea nil]|uniref:cytochrome b561 and DOMON domain-containing protein At5g47530-like n=1 Tax=Ipomoea nil TaxID=35883 RepID=UPI0009017320|nr:PREDICTED: cytochrome b561 and DOMON domain-containing protein At5g47530-like [Ipomoea nil]